LFAAALLSLSALALAGGGLGACYSTPTPECAFLCGPSGECPDGYGCRNDGWCKRDGVPSDFQCSILPDAGGPDGTPADAGPDAMPPDAAL
jgi:hypothetical protein